MKYRPVFLRTENQLNKLLKRQKKTGEQLTILFISLWDDWCSELVGKINHSKEGHPLYIVDSFAMPHSFVIFNSFKLPHLVKLKKGNVSSEDYLPNIYKVLKVSSD
jgi:hypothetical protein